MTSIVYSVYVLHMYMYNKRLTTHTIDSMNNTLLTLFYI